MLVHKNSHIWAGKRDATMTRTGKTLQFGNSRISFTCPNMAFVDKHDSLLVLALEFRGT